MQLLLACARTDSVQPCSMMLATPFRPSAHLCRVVLCCAVYEGSFPSFRVCVCVVLFRRWFGSGISLHWMCKARESRDARGRHDVQAIPSTFSLLTERAALH